MELTSNAPNWNATFALPFVDTVDFRLSQPRPAVFADKGPMIPLQGPWPAQGPWDGYQH
jgi:hypothetical protein